MQRHESDSISAPDKAHKDKNIYDPGAQSYCIIYLRVLPGCINDLGAVISGFNARFLSFDFVLEQTLPVLLKMMNDKKLLCSARRTNAASLFVLVTGAQQPGGGSKDNFIIYSKIFAAVCML